MDALVFPRRWFDHRVAPDVPEAQRRHAPQSSWDFADHVQHQIALRIGLVPVSAAAIAAAMGMPRRSFDRRLERSGTAFRELVDDLRYARARRLLAAGHIPLADISMALGYTEPSAFSRAFRAWSGVSPQHWRKSHAEVHV
jgi:AraC-like DNA-binding protein